MVKKLRTTERSARERHIGAELRRRNLTKAIIYLWFFRRLPAAADISQLPTHGGGSRVIAEDKPVEMPATGKSWMRK